MVWCILVTQGIQNTNSKHNNGIPEYEHGNWNAKSFPETIGNC